MKSLVIHQLVHGYEHGHSLLAASTTLDREDLDLVGRLSDLSGALGPDLKVSPYLSLFPLPSKKFFAVARTWLDDSATRSGCVLTHTILVPLHAWATDDSPSRFAAILRMPSRAVLSEYTVPITTVPGSPEVRSTEPLSDSFIQRYFGEGLAPIAWFGALDAESSAWCVIQALWPSLRERFACCTLSLQPRTLGDRPFDLVFAPSAVFARFGEFARDHIVDGRAPVAPGGSETWFRSWSKCVFGGDSDERCKRARALSSDLEPHPTAIRTVMFFLELLERAGESPTAALGALDLLAKLAPQPFRALDEKRALTAAALRSIKILPSSEARELLYLLCRRLEENPFKQGQDLEAEVRDLVERLISNDPEQGIIDANLLLARHAEAAPSLFMLGVSDATVKLLGSKSTGVSLFLERPKLVERVIPYRPEIPALILNLTGITDRDRVVLSIVDWCRADQSSGVRDALRWPLLLEVIGPGDAPLVEELLRDLKADEAGKVCDFIEKRDVFRQGPLLATVSRLAGERHPDAVRLWSRTHSWNSYQLANLIAAGYPSTVDGLAEVLAEENSDSANWSQVLAAFIDRVSLYSLPSWLITVLEENLTCWELLLRGLNDDAVSDVVIRLIRGGVRRSAIARAPDALRMLATTCGHASSNVRVYAVRQLVADYFETFCDIGKVKLWFDEPWVVEALAHIGVDSVDGMITDRLFNSPGSWICAWKIVEILPDVVAFENKDFVQELIATLLRNRPPDWSVEASDSWQHLLSKLSWDRIQIDLCTQALHFAFENRRYPLAGIVAETFYPVHETAMGSRPKKGLWFAWGFDSWDEAKDLRRSLVNSFLHSDWPSSHFALAARERWLLRKLCTRMLRQWGGSKYLESAHMGLKKLSSHRAQQLAVILHQILQEPGITEDWD